MRRWVLLFALTLRLPAQDDLPNGKGKETLENTCTECHGLDKALARLRTRENWQAVAVLMRSRGATMSDDELKTLVEYLFQNFGKDEVNINKATAREIEKTLEIPAKDAAAIVRHRESKGPFKDWQDVAKVDGVDKVRIEAKKDRIAF